MLASAAAPPVAPTFNKDILPIIESRCQTCHRPGEIGPMPLITYEQTKPWAKAIQEAGVPVYSISLLQALRIMADPYMSATKRMEFLQADNTLNTFGRESGGQAFFPRFTGEFPSIYKSISDALRNQYSIAYQPSNQAKDGKYRKLKVELVDPANGNPLRIADEKGKPMKYSIVAKQGYTAPHEVE